MDVATALTRLGGVATGTALREQCGARAVRRAVARHDVVRASRNRYVLPDAGAALTAAARLHGKASHRSAALVHGWEIAFPPDRPHVTVPRGRNVPESRRDGVAVHWTRSWGGEDPVTGPVQTVLDCARDLPFAEALAVADSALRHSSVSVDDLRAAADALAGAGSRRVRRVVAHADPGAANPFESVLRALVIEAGFSAVTQLPIEVDGLVLHPDIADVDCRLVVEADSWTHHAGKDEDELDCARYNALVGDGWTVLRFTWQQAMLSPSYVRFVLAKVQGRSSERSEASQQGRDAA